MPNGTEFRAAIRTPHASAGPARPPLAWWVLIALAAALPGCQRPERALPSLHDVALDEVLPAEQITKNYGAIAFVYRNGPPNDPHVAIFTDNDLPADTLIDDRNLLIFAEGSGDQAEHFYRTARLIAESRYHPPTADGPNLLILLLHWSESRNTVQEHLNYPAQAHAAQVLQRMCAVQEKRHPHDGWISIIGFSAGTRVTQLAFGASLPAGRPGDKPPELEGVPTEMRRVSNVVYLGSSINRNDPLPFGELRGRFINFVNARDTHYGDRAPYFAPAGTSPVLLRVVEANLFLARPRTGASANGFIRLPTLSAEEQFELVEVDPRVDRAFRMVNVEAPPELIPWSVASLPIFEDNLDDYWNFAPNHYSMVGRGPQGSLESATFDQYKEQSFEFVREQVSSAALTGRVYEFHLKSQPHPSILPVLLDPIRLILPTEPLKAILAPPEGGK